MASIAALSVGVPARDMERTMLYMGSSSLNVLSVYINHLIIARLPIFFNSFRQARIVLRYEKSEFNEDMK